MEVILHAPAALPPGRSPSTYSRSAIFTGIRTQDCSVRSVVAIPLRYSGSRMNVNQEEIPKRRRGGFRENRMEEKKGKTQRTVRKKKEKKLTFPDAETEERNTEKEENKNGGGGRCVRLTNLPPSCAVVMKSGNLNFQDPSGPLQACNGTA